ncbi:MAG TPA: ROK family protein [Acidimicrobiia bacterium]|nr:ROK family protein [Acidimicrobiia bacterium]
MTRPTIGLDIGGTNLRAAVVDRDGVVLTHRREVSAGAWEPMRGHILEVIAALRAEHDVAAVGIGAAGLVDRDGVIRYAPNVPGFLNTPVRSEIEEAIGLPTIVENDANAAAWGELTHGAARGADDALIITLGTGVGGGIVSGGRLLRGANSFGGEIGHFTVDVDGPMCACGEPGHWEALASGTALGRMARDAAAAGTAPAVLAAAGGRVDAVTGIHVSDAARHGAPDALALVTRYAEYVALGLIGLANILDPEIVVVSGGLIAEGEMLLGPVRSSFADRIEGTAYRPTPPIVVAELGDTAGTVGAAMIARSLVQGSGA